MSPVRVVWKSANQSPANVADAWLPAAFGAGWAGNPSGLGVAPTDPTTLVAVVATITLVGAVACVIPAWRASRVDPIVVLRDE